MNYGITPQGFIRKPYSVILQELQDQSRLGDYFGPDIDLSDASPVGIRIKLDAWAIDRQWALAEEVYYSLWINTAEGVSLDRVARLGFVSRDPAQHAIVLLEYAGIVGSTIPLGSQAETSQNVVFETIEEQTIGESGIVQVYAQCIQAGTDGNVPAGAITSIKTPITGVDSVTNPLGASGGRSGESDAEVRANYEDLPASTGSSIDAIRGAVSGIAGVMNVIGLENTLNVEDATGIPPRSIEVIVNGGLDEAIAQMIFSKKSSGVETYGTSVVVVVDSQGLPHDIRFSRPAPIDVYIIYEINSNSDWISDNIVSMKRNAVAYVGGIDDLLIQHPGLGNGGTVLAWKLAAIQSGISGIENISVKLGRAPEPAESDNLEFLARELPRATMANIVVAVS